MRMGFSAFARGVSREHAPLLSKGFREILASANNARLTACHCNRTPKAHQQRQQAGSSFFYCCRLAAKITPQKLFMADTVRRYFIEEKKKRTKNVRTPAIFYKSIFKTNIA